MYYAMGDWVKAEEMFKRSLDIKRKNKAPLVSLVNSIINMATAMWHKALYTEGLETLQEAFDILEEYPTMFQHTRALAHKTRGVFYNKMEEFERAEECFLSAWKTTLSDSPNYPFMCELCSHLARVSDSMGRHRDVVQWARECIPFIEHYSKERPHDLTIYGNLKLAIIAYKSLGESSNASEMYGMAKKELDRVHINLSISGNLTKLEVLKRKYDDLISISLEN